MKEFLGFFEETATGRSDHRRKQSMATERERSGGEAVVGGRVGGPVGRATFRLTMAALLAVPVAVVAAGPAAASPPSTLFSSTTAGTYSVQVPAGVTSVSITAVGGQGGPSFPGTSSAPGEAAIVSAAVSVNPGDTLTITVAGNGAEAAPPGFGNPGSGAGSGGFGDKELGGGGGGGGSAVFDGSAALVVAGGGGGAAQGANGGGAGQDGNDPGGFDRGGHAGTQTGPGEPGSGCPLGASAGSGMNGGDGNSGGGGGGFFGGAGGCGNAGGGGGSSFPAADVTGLDPTGTPSVVITYDAVVPAVSIATSQQPASAAVGSQFADSATVTGGSNPTGTVTFNLYNNPNGTGTPLFTDTEPLIGRRRDLGVLYGDRDRDGLLGGDVQRRLGQQRGLYRQRRRAGDDHEGHTFDLDKPAAGGRNGGIANRRSGNGFRRLQPDGNGHLQPLQQPERHRHATVHRHRTTRQWRRHIERIHGGFCRDRLLGRHLQRRRQQQLGDLGCIERTGDDHDRFEACRSERRDQRTLQRGRWQQLQRAGHREERGSGERRQRGHRRAHAVWHDGQEPRRRQGLFGLVFWTAPQINAGTSVTYTITFTVAAHAKGTTLIPAVTASMVNPDPRRANNRAITSVTLGR